MKECPKRPHAQSLPCRYDRHFWSIGGYQHSTWSQIPLHHFPRTRGAGYIGNLIVFDYHPSMAR
jgi:hypothetical protein